MKLKLLPVLLMLCGMGWGQDSLQEFVVTVPVSTVEPIHVRAKDRLWAEAAALHTTVWTAQEWKECADRGVCDNPEIDCGKTITLGRSSKRISDIFPTECGAKPEDLTIGGEHWTDEESCAIKIRFKNNDKAISDIFPEECPITMKELDAGSVHHAYGAPKSTPECAIAFRLGPDGKWDHSQLKWSSCAVPTVIPRISYDAEADTVVMIETANEEQIAEALTKHCHIDRYDPGYDPNSSHINIGFPPQERKPSWVKAESLRIVCAPAKAKE